MPTKTVYISILFSIAAIKKREVKGEKASNKELFIKLKRGKHLGKSLGDMELA